MKKIKQFKAKNLNSPSKIIALMAIFLAGAVGAFMLFRTQAVTPVNNSANRQIWWIAASRTPSELTCATLTDADLDKFKSWGIGGFVCQASHLGRGMGGGEWTGDPNADALNNPANANYSRYEVQRKLKESNIVARAKARGMKMYLGFWAANYNNGKTFYHEWYDDGAWASVVIPNIRDIAGAAKSQGFDGLNIDQEDYYSPNGVPSWSNSGTVPGGTTDLQVRAKVKQRGQEVMAAMLQSYPAESLEVMFYANIFPGGWEALVQCEVNGFCGSDNSSGAFYIDFWDGMTSVNGYKNIRYQDAVFYKTTHRNSSYDNALQYNANKVYAYLSRRWSNWDYASSRFAVTPFIWIDDDCEYEGAFAANRPTAGVAEQLAAYSKWSPDGQFSNFTYNGLNSKNYADYYSANCATKVENYDANRPYNYIPSIQSTAVPRVVDSELPTINLITPTTSTTYNTTDGSLNLTGKAYDNMAIRYVKWQNDRGGNGVAQMTWQVLSGDYTTSYNWQMNWTITGIPLQAGQNCITLTAMDIKGLSTTSTLTVNPGGSGCGGVTPPPADTTAPNISGVSAGTITSNGANLTWNTNETSDSQVEYGTTTSYGSSTAVNGSLVTNHSISLAGLNASTTYNYRVKSKDASGNLAVSSNATFTTSTPTPPPAAALKILKTISSPVIDGSLSEYNGANSVTFGTPQTNNSANVRALWDANNLYLAYQVSDSQLNATATAQDGEAYNYDAVEWFVDTLGNSCTVQPTTTACMLADDYQGITSLANSRYDTRGTASGSPDVSWNGSWTSAVTTQGTVGNNADSDTMFQVEIMIPWSSIGVSASPANESSMRLGLALDDKDVAGSSYIMWPNTTSAFQNATKWQAVTLSGTQVSVTPDTAKPTAPASLTATSTSPTQVNLSWTPSTDNIAVASYQVRRGGNAIATISCASGACSANPMTFADDSGLTASTAYSYTITAQDAAGNISEPSNTGSVTTSGIVAGPRSGDINRDGRINFDDALAVIRKWNTPDPDADLTLDGTVNFDDALQVIRQWRN